MQLSKAPSGVAQIVFCECEWDDIPTVSANIMAQINATLIDRVSGAGEWMAIVQIAGQTFCLSWDDWLFEMTLMGWDKTPDDAVSALYHALESRDALA